MAACRFQGFVTQQVGIVNGPLASAVFDGVLEDGSVQLAVHDWVAAADDGAELQVTALVIVLIGASMRGPLPHPVATCHLCTGFQPVLRQNHIGSVAGCLLKSTAEPGCSVFVAALSKLSPAQRPAC